MVVHTNDIMDLCVHGLVHFNMNKDRQLKWMLYVHGLVRFETLYVHGLVCFETNKD